MSKFKSFGEMYLANYLDEKKKEADKKAQSTGRLEKLRDEALKMYKQTKNEEYADKAKFYDNILNHADARNNGLIGKKAA